MGRIERLTPQQEEELEQYREQQLLIGLSTEPVDRARVERAMTCCYELVGETPPKYLWFDSPRSLVLCRHVLRSIPQLGDQLWDQLWGQLRDQLGDQLRGQLGDELMDQLRDQLGDQLGDQLMDQLWGQLGGQLGDELRGQLWGQLGDQLGDQLMGQLWGQLWGQLGDQLGDQLMGQLWGQLGDEGVDRSGCWHWGGMDIAWVSFYRFCARIGVKYNQKDDSTLELHEDLCHGGWIYPHKGLCLMSERPYKSHWSGRKLHRDGGPAASYRDGFAVWSLNGVRVPQWLAETPEGEMDASRITEVSNNVEVAREFVRKVGVERVYQSLGGKTLDTTTYTNDTGDHPYELITMEVYKNQDPRPYLKMVNPSLEGIFHLERVPLGTTTVREALLFRNGMTENEVDEESGEDWYQQGDVVLKPKGAKKLKLFPKVLT